MCQTTGHWLPSCCEPNYRKTWGGWKKLMRPNRLQRDVQDWSAGIKVFRVRADFDFNTEHVGVRVEKVRDMQSSMKTRTCLHKTPENNPQWGVLSGLFANAPLTVTLYSTIRYHKLTYSIASCEDDHRVWMRNKSCGLTAVTLDLNKNKMGGHGLMWRVREVEPVSGRASVRSFQQNSG